MSKRVFIIHGWGGYPDEGWLPWLKIELEKKNFEVFIPAMPDTDEPKINSWVSHLQKIAADANKTLILLVILLVVKQSCAF